MNLTTVIEAEAAASRHYGESLFLASKITMGRVVDVGSGPGFPGIPVAIARPDCQVDLVESHQRKAVFLREACRNLPNARVLAVRAESLQVETKYDWLISRAVDPASLARLRLAKEYAVLMGEDDASALQSPELLPLPWGNRRVLALGRFT